MRRKIRYEPGHGVLAVKADIFGMLFDEPEMKEEPFKLEMDGQVAVVEVEGPLARKSGWFWTSYEDIERAVHAALESSAKSVVLRFDSPGGDAMGCFETAQTIKNLSASEGKPIYAYADDTMCSAAYALACGCEKIFMGGASQVGSVGVLCAIPDVTAQDAMFGMKLHIITSGARKADGNPHQALSEQARGELQSRVDTLAAIFFDLVAGARGVSAAHVRGLEGRLYVGATAIGAGLADEVMSWAQVLAFAAGSSSEKTAGESPKGEVMDEKKKEEATKAIRAAYGDDKDGADKAIKAAFPPEEKKDEKAETKEETKAEEKSPTEEKNKETEKKDAKAESEEKKEEEAKAQALIARAKGGDLKALQDLTFQNLAENQKLRAQIAEKDEKVEREALFAKRPDFDANIRATLAMMPVDKVKEAVEKWPRVGTPQIKPPASLAVSPTLGANQVDGPHTEVPKSEADFIARKMGMTESPTGIRRTNGGKTVELGAMSPEQAQEFLKKVPNPYTGESAGKVH